MPIQYREIKIVQQYNKSKYDERMTKQGANMFSVVSDVVLFFVFLVAYKLLYVT